MSRRATVQQRFPRFVADQREFFDRLITEDWDTYLDSGWDTVRAYEVDLLFAHVSAARILDVGCGCGYHDLLMAQRPGVIEVVGIDYSSKSIEAAERAYPHPCVARRAADIHTLPLGGFDLAVSFQVIEHTPDPVRFLAVCADQVRPGGWVAVVTPNGRRLGNRLRGLVGLPPRWLDPQHFREYTTAEIETFGRAVGLQPAARFGYGLHPRVPGTGRTLLPLTVALRLGTRCPALAHCFGVVFRKSA